ncbi:MAG: hypothetical protein V3V78_03890 [Candidatus Woesearchaeota archaeon]
MVSLEEQAQVIVGVLGKEYRVLDFGYDEGYTEKGLKYQDDKLRVRVFSKPLSRKKIVEIDIPHWEVQACLSPRVSKRADNTRGDNKVSHVSIHRLEYDIMYQSGEIENITSTEWIVHLDKLYKKAKRKKL